MANVIPSTQTIIDTNLTTFETKLNQSSPLGDKAFLRVLSVLMGMNMTQLYKFGVERAVQNLALTASEQDLDFIGINYGVFRKAAESSVLTIDVDGNPGATISATNSYVGDSNAVRYTIASSVVIPAGGTESFDVTATEQSAAGNLNVDDTLTITNEAPGVATVAAVSAVVNLGTDRESDDDYRVRVLDEIRTVGGGSNSADHRRWSQDVSGVQRAYPYTGKPVGVYRGTWDASVNSPALASGVGGAAYYYLVSVSGSTNLDGITDWEAGDYVFFNGAAWVKTFSSDSIPGDRVVYVEADETIDPDGIAPQTLLDDVRDSISTDPVTGEDRPCLGSTDETLFVLSIARIGFLFNITGLSVSSDREADAKSDIATEVDARTRQISMFVDGIDSEVDRNDTLSSVNASEWVSDVLKKYGGYAQSVSVGLAPGSYLGSYTVNPGELLKSTGVTYD